MIPWDILAELSPAALGWILAGASTWMVLTGRLVPRSLYSEQKQSAETWRAAWQAERDNLTKLVVPNAELQRQVLQAIPAHTPVPVPAEEGGMA